MSVLKYTVAASLSAVEYNYCTAFSDDSSRRTVLQNAAEYALIGAIMGRK